MPFPKARRVLYEKNPLKQVICQLRFPTLLKIDAQSPADFQEAIRGSYPAYKEKLELGIPDEIARVLPPNILDIQAGRQRTYEFISDDQNWAVTLTRDFLALTSTKYERRSHFIDHLREPLDALISIYKPAYFTRIGLRYQDVIQRSKLNLAEQHWANLLKPQIAGILLDAENENVSDYVTQIVNDAVIGLENGISQVHLRHGFIEHEGETSYLIDSDFYTEERTEVDNAIPILEYFGERGSLLFQWCITDVLHKAMEPTDI